MDNLISYPYLNSYDQLSTFKKLKKKEYRKLTKKDLKSFEIFAVNVDREEMEAYEIKRYYQ